MVVSGDLTCPNCGAGYGPDDIFCESCGYDFITGSLPTPDEAAAAGVVAPGVPSAPSPSMEVGGDGPPSAPTTAGTQPVPSDDPTAVIELPVRLRITVSADADFFAAAVAEGELDFPVPPPPDAVMELSGGELHIGRTSESRAIHPDIDIAELTGDPAVSSRHAVLRVSPDGEVSVTDVGSTNGTFLDDPASSPVTVGEQFPVGPGVPVYVGAWTRIVIDKLEE